MVKLFRKQNQLPHISDIHLDEEDDCSYGSGTEARISEAPPSTIRMKKKNNKSVSPSKLIDLYLDEEKGSTMPDDDSIGGASETSSLPPPPPPLAERKRSIFRSQPAPELSLPREAYVFEEQNSFEAQDISLWPSYWNRWSASGTVPGSGRRMRRRLLAAMACVLVVCIILGLASIGNKDNDAGQTSSFAGAQGAEDTTQEDPVTPAPSPSPVATPPTPAPVAAAVTPAPATPADAPSPVATPGPVADPEPTPTPAPIATPAPTPAPVEPPTCSDNVDTNKSCYGLEEIILVGFTNCDTVHDDWIGIYNVDNILSSDSLGPGYSKWLWTCESEDLTECRNTAMVGAIMPFGGGLPAGTYQAFLVRTNENDEYVPYASSAAFEFSDSCP